MQFSAIHGWNLLLLVVGVFAGLGRWLCSVCVRGVQRVRSPVCGPLYHGLGACVCVGVACVSLVRVWLRARVVGGPSPILAEGPGRISLPFLAEVCCCWWWVVPRQSWLRFLGAALRQFWLGSAAGGGGRSLAKPGTGPWVRSPAIPRWGPLLVVVGCPLPFLAEGPGCSFPPLLAELCCSCWWVVPRQSWLRVLGAVVRHLWLVSAAVVVW